MKVKQPPKTSRTPSPSTVLSPHTASDDLVFNFQKLLKKRKEQGQTEKQNQPLLHSAPSLQRHPFFSLFQNEKLIILILILIPLFFGVYIRSAPAWIPQAQGIAQEQILTRFVQEQLQSIQKTNPALSDDDKKRIIRQRAAAFQNSDEFETAVGEFKQQLKDPYKDATGFLYLIGADSYHYTRYIRNIIDHGYPGDSIRDGRQFDTLMLAPTGKVVTKNFHVYAGAYFYTIASLFMVNASREGILFFFPVFFSAIVIIFAFYLGRKLGGNLAGFFTALFIALHYTVVARTMGGIVDTDVYVVFFPLAIVWLYFEMITAESLKKKLAWSAGAGILTGLFAFAWTGWWYIYDFLLIATVLYVCYNFLVFFFEHRPRRFDVSFFKTKQFTHLFHSVITYLLVTNLLILFFKRLKNVFDPYTSVIDFLSFGKEVKSGSLWPNVLLTVKELERVNLAFIIDAVGIWILLFALFGALLLLYQGIQLHRQALLRRDSVENHRGQNPFIFYVAFLVIYTLGSLFAVTYGVRFLIVLIIPIALLCSFFLSSAILSLSNLGATFFPFFTRSSHVIPSLFVIILTVGAMLFLGFSPFSSLCLQGACKQTLVGIHSTGPTIDDIFIDTLTKLQMRTGEDAILTSWWDYGHIFKYFANRAVTFDGASQNTPQAYFVGRFFVTHNEKEALGILRMLHCGGNATVSLLENEFEDDTRKVVELTNKLVVVSKRQGRALLEKQNFSSDTVERILSTTYCTPPESYVILTKDMIGKASAWGHIGFWNFTRAKMLQDIQSLPKDQKEQGILKLQTEFALSQEQAEKTYIFLQTTSSIEIQEWLAPWVLYSKDIVGCKIADASGTMLRCPNYLNENEPGTYELSFTSEGEMLSAVVKGPQGQYLTPQSVIFMKRDQLFEYAPKTDKQKSPFSLALLQDSTGMSSFVLSPQLSLSMFTRLAYYDGAGLSYFKLFTASEGHNPIQVWKVSWPSVEE
ncbi:TPA: hypothetical protein HA249_07070 [Candidatus Woesearchaeota archaeon]|nr:hypothetical protein [Candidatus Woesearchaeota archaeon]